MFQVMSANKDIQRAWLSYSITLDCLKIARKSIKKDQHNVLLDKTIFLDLPKDRALQDIDDSQQHAEDYLILTVWAYFERNLFLKLNQDLINPRSKLINDKIQDHMERLEMKNGLLDALKSVISSELIGNAKQIYDYRNWIAHRNPKKTPPAMVTPDFAYQVLSEITNQLDERVLISNL